MTMTKANLLQLVTKRLIHYRRHLGADDAAIAAVSNDLADVLDALIEERPSEAPDPVEVERIDHTVLTVIASKASVIPGIQLARLVHVRTDHILWLSITALQASLTRLKAKGCLEVARREDTEVPLGYVATEMGRIVVEQERQRRAAWRVKHGL